jgi:hypothetical protein
MIIAEIEAIADHVADQAVALAGPDRTACASDERMRADGESDCRVRSVRGGWRRICRAGESGTPPNGGGAGFSSSGERDTAEGAALVGCLVLKR